MLFPQALRNISKFLAHVARLRHGISNGNGTDVISLERHHASELALMHQVNGSDSVPRRQHAIKSGWRAAALDVTKHYGTRLKAGAGFYLRCQRITDAAKTHVPKFVSLSALMILGPVGELGSFSHHNNAEVASAVMPVLDRLCNLLNIKRLFMYQAHVRSAG